MNDPIVKADPPSAGKQRIRTQTAVVEALSLKNLVEIFLRRFWLIPTPLLLIPLLTIGASFLIRPSYLSTITIALGKAEILNPLVRYDTAVALTEHNRLTLLRKIIYSRPLLEQAISRLGLDADFKSPRDFERKLDDLRQSIQLMELDDDSFQIGCHMDDPVLARDLVKTVCDLFIELSLEGSRREAFAAVKFIGEEMATYDGKLRHSESRLEEFKTENVLVMQRMDKLDTRLEDARSKKYKAAQELESTELKIKLLDQQFETMTPLIVDQLIYQRENAYRSELKVLEIQRAKLLGTHLETSREVVALGREIASLIWLAEEDETRSPVAETHQSRSTEYDQTKSRLDELRVNASVLKNEVAMQEKMETGSSRS